MLSFTDPSVWRTFPRELFRRLLVAIVSIGLFTKHSIFESLAPEKNETSELVLDCKDSCLLLTIAGLYSGLKK